MEMVKCLAQQPLGAWPFLFGTFDMKKCGIMAFFKISRMEHGCNITAFFLTFRKKLKAKKTQAKKTQANF